MKIVEKIWGHQFYQGSFLLTLSSLGVYIFNYLFNFLAGRSLGPVGYGEITSLFAYQYISLVPITVFTMIIIQKINAVAEPLSFSRALEVFFWEKLRRVWFLAFLTLPLLPFLPAITNLAPLVSYSLIPFFILSFLAAFYAAALQGLRLFWIFSIIAIAASAIKLLGAVLTAWGIDGMTTILFFIFISLLYTLIESWRKYHRAVKILDRSTFIVIDRRLTHILKNRQLLTTAAAVFSLALLNNADIVFVKKFFSDFDAGIYGAWSLFAKIVWYLLTPILLTSFIFFSDNQKIRQHRKLFGGVLILLIAAGVVSYFGYLWLGDWAVSLLLGDKFVSVIPYLARAALFGSLYSLITFFSNYFLARKNPAALLLPCLMPVYFVGLFVVGNNLASIMKLNLIFTAFAVLIHTVVYVYSLKH